MLNNTIERKLQGALEVIDQIDTYRQPWDEVDEALHRVEGEILEVRKGLKENGGSTMGNQEIQRSQSSVEISTNAKGEKSWKVKAYADTIAEAIMLATDADQKVMAECAGCGGEIYEGEDVYDINGDITHSEWECLVQYVDPEVIPIEEALK